LDRPLHRRQHWRGWSGLSDTNTNFSDTLGSTFSAATNAQFLGGGQVGVNYEFANAIVIGAEATFDGLPNSQNATVTATDPAGTVAANIGTLNVRWLGTVSGRLGYAWDRMLLYAKGGGVWVATNSPAISVAGTPASFNSISNTTTSGYTAGFGFEWAFSGNWSVRAEYAYIELPNQTFTVAPRDADFRRRRHHVQQSQHFDGHRRHQLQTRRLVWNRCSHWKIGRKRCGSSANRECER
jgi:opacity protein-like surface antigen